MNPAPSVESRSADRPDVFYLSWNLTAACNLRCVHCYVGAGRRLPGELTLEEVKHAADGARALGVRGIFLAGGEPLLRSDICAVAAHLADRGFAVYLNTNGTMLDHTVCKRLISSGVLGVSVGLEAFDRERYSAFRGEDVFESVVGGLASCVEAGLPVNVDFTLTKMNYLDCGLVHDFAQAHGCVRVTLKRFVPEGRGRTNQADLALTPEEHKQAMETWYRESTRNKDRIASGAHDPLYVVYLATIGKLEAGDVPHMDCNAGGGRRGWLAIAPDGEVYPCPLMRSPKLGNIREKSLVDIAHDEACASVRDTDRRPAGKCRSCEYQSICRGGCTAYSRLSGAFPAPDPLCWVHPTDDTGCILPTTPRLHPANDTHDHSPMSFTG